MVNGDIRSMKCEYCGAALEYEAGQTLIKCKYCGNQFQIEAGINADDVTITDADVIAILRTGKKVEAIKLAREKTSMGLKECKEYVEELAEREGIVLKSGCAGVLVLGVLATVIVVGGFAIMYV